MNSDSENVTTATVKKIEDLVAHAQILATQSRAATSSWAVLNSIYLASQSAMAIIPETHNLERKRIHQRCMEAILTEVAVAERRVETALISTLFDELCKQGFSSQTSAVSMAGIYCRWLKSRGQIALVDDVIARVSPHIVHPNIKESLKVVVEKSLHADDPATMEEEVAE